MNSGVFTKFPVLHKIVLNSRWARRRIFEQFAAKAVNTTKVPDHYIAQAVFRVSEAEANPIRLDGTTAALSKLFGRSQRVLVLGRSGTGKSVLLNYLTREMMQHFLRGEDQRLPVLLDLRTHPLAGQPVEALIRDALKGGQVELPDDLLDYLIRKGGFLLLIDSLNELADRAAAEAFHPFLNRDAGNFLIMASQVDLLQRQDFVAYRLAEVSEDQARAYLEEVAGAEYGRPAGEAKALARNPQDLELLAEVAKALGARKVPTRRAELYREILHNDTALAD